jgi:hypothetical protein
MGLVGHFPHINLPLGLISSFFPIFFLLGMGYLLGLGSSLRPTGFLTRGADDQTEMRDLSPVLVKSGDQ